MCLLALLGSKSSLIISRGDKEAAKSGQSVWIDCGWHAQFHRSPKSKPRLWFGILMVFSFWGQRYGDHSRARAAQHQRLRLGLPPHWSCSCALHAGSVVHASASRPRLGNPVSDAPIDSSRVWVDGLIWASLSDGYSRWCSARSTTGLSRAARWNCSTADGRGSAPRKTWIAGQARPSGSPAPRSTSLHPRPGTRKLRDILRGDHWPLVSIEEIV